MSNPVPRTAFVFDMVPWKVTICEHKIGKCPLLTKSLLIRHLPDPPEPGRVPEGADHVHIEKKYAGSAGSDIAEDRKWRALMKSVARCSHGRIMKDACPQCPGREAPDETGTLIGYTQQGKKVRVPPRDALDDIRAWIQD